MSDSGDGDEPTMVVRVQERFRRSAAFARPRQATCDSDRAVGSGLVPPRAPNFESKSSLDQASPFSPPKKVLRFGPLGPNPIEGLSDLRDAAAAAAAAREASRETEELKTKLADCQAKLVEARAGAAKWEGQVLRTEAQLKKVRLEKTAEVERATLDLRRAREERDAAKNQIKLLKRKEQHRIDEDRESWLERNKRRHDAEDDNAALLEENDQLEEKIRELEEETSAKIQAAVKSVEEKDHEIRMLKSRVGELTDVLEVEKKARKDSVGLRKQVQALESELAETKLEAEQIKSELSQNEDAITERKTMRDRLMRFPGLQREVESLKRQNELLRETMGNQELLQEQTSGLKDDLARAHAKVESGLKAESELVVSKERLREWEAVTKKFFMPHELTSLGDVISPAALEIKLDEFRKADVILRGTIEELKSSLKEGKLKEKNLEEQLTSVNSSLQACRSEQSDQTKLIKRLQRKLLLVSKERDSFKGVLDSYEKELTFTGGQFEGDKIAALEKTVQNYKDMVEKLENQLYSQKPSESASVENVTDDREKAALLDKISHLKGALLSMQENRDQLQEELEKMRSDGQGDERQERVIHFRDNPTAIAVNMRKKQVQSLTEENDALKARVKLLEEGQTKDLTLLVGHKVEEGASSKEVQDLQEKLRLADLRKERLIEAFRKTSTDFREVCCQLTGYRIDGLDDSKYRLTPVYAESPHDHLLFRRERTGELLMLETQFSGQLEELIELHLGQQRSIPVFLAAVITDLFSRQTFDTDYTVATTETGGGGDDNPICID